MARASSFTILNSLGPEARTAVPELLGLLKANDLQVAGNSIQMLGSIGMGAAPAIPAILEAMKHKATSWHVAVPVLGRLGYRAKEAAPSLTSDIIDSPRGFDGICGFSLP